VLLLAAAAPGRAQMRPADRPVSDISVGYSYLHDSVVLVDQAERDIGGHFPIGWQASASYNVHPAIGLVADVSGHYKKTDLVPDSGDSELKFSVHALHGGVRVTGRGDLRPYAQLLAGLTRSTVSVSGMGSSVNDFSLQPGVGLMLPLGNAIALGIGGDYRLVFTEVEKTTELRAHVGLVFQIYP
jgi:hypothetical protein